MSDCWSIIIPDDPTASPAVHRLERARDVLAVAMPEADEIVIESNGEVGFVDAGGNSDGVFCPRCGTDLEDWWGDAMAAAAESGFEELEAALPCCSMEMSLNDLEYRGGGGGFAKWSIAARNPNVVSISPAVMGQVSSALDCAVRVIWRHL